MDTEAVKSYLAENPDASKEVLESFKESYVIRSKDEDATWRENYEQDVVSKKTREFAENLEKDVLELSGIEKEEGEKYHAYNKRAYNAIAEKAKKVKSLESKIEELQSANADETLKKELDQYKAKIEELNSTHSQEKEEIFNKFNGERKMLEVNSATQSLQFGDYPKDLLDRAIKDVQKEIMDMPSKIIEGKVVFLDDNGDILKDSESFENVTANDLIKERLSSVIKKTEEGKKGLGTKAPAPSGSFSVPADVKTKVQLTRYLNELGHATNSDKYKEIFREHSKDLPLR